MLFFLRFLLRGYLVLYCLFSSALHFRSVQSGNWSDLTSWECSVTAAFLNSSPALSIPDCNDDNIIIRDGHTITYNGSWCIDEVQVEQGGVLSSSNAGSVFWNISNGAGTDLRINGTLEDHTPLASQWQPQSTWGLGTNGTIVRSRSTASSAWRDHYENGIANIPASSNWILRKTSTDQPTLTTAAMYYGNLKFENYTSSAWNAAAASSKFSGLTSQAPVIKGSLHIGDSVRPGIIVYTETPAEITIRKNLHIGLNSQLVLNDHSSHSGAVGFQIAGHLYLSGSIISVHTDANGINRMIRLSGTYSQYIHCYTPQQFLNAELTSTNKVYLNGTLEVLNSIKISNQFLNVSNGFLHIQNGNTNALRFSPTSALFDEDPLHQIHFTWLTAATDPYLVHFGNSNGNISTLSLTRLNIAPVAIGIHSMGTSADNSNTISLPQNDHANIYSDRYWKLESSQPIEAYLDMNAASDETPFYSNYSLVRLIGSTPSLIQTTELISNGWYGIVANASLEHQALSSSVVVSDQSSDEIYKVFDFYGREYDKAKMENGKVYMVLYRSGKVEKMLCIE